MCSFTTFGQVLTLTCFRCVYKHLKATHQSYRYSRMKRWEPKRLISRKNAWKQTYCIDKANRLRSPASHEWQTCAQQKRNCGPPPSVRIDTVKASSWFVFGSVHTKQLWRHWRKSARMCGCFPFFFFSPAACLGFNFVSVVRNTVSRLFPPPPEFKIPSQPPQKFFRVSRILTRKNNARIFSPCRPVQTGSGAHQPIQW